MRFTFQFQPHEWTIGLVARRKPDRLWVKLPMCTWLLCPAKECPNCKGQGGWQIEAGDGCWYDECETCNGTGRVK